MTDYFNELFKETFKKIMLPLIILAIVIGE